MNARCLALIGMIGLASPAPLFAQDFESSGTRNPKILDGEPLLLSEAIASALSTHPLIDRASGSLDAAEAGVRVAGATRLPQAALAASTTRFAEPMVVAPLHGFDPSRPPSFDRTLIQGRAEASYRLFDGGARGALVESARAGAAAGEADLRGAREQVLAGVTTAYANLAAARLRREAASQRLMAAAAEKARADRLFAEGAVAEVETLRAEAERLAAEAGFGSATAELDVTQRALARWMGVEAGALLRRPIEDLAVDAERIFPVDTLASAAVERAASGVRRADAELEAARAAWLPTLDLQAALLEFGSAEGEFQSEWQAGVAVRFPAFTGGARGAEIDRARAASRAAAAELELARLRQGADIDRAWAVLVATTATAEALRERADALEEVWRITELALEEGAGTQREYLDAAADTYDTYAALADARAEQVRAMVELGSARGQLTEAWIYRLLGLTP